MKSRRIFIALIIFFLFAAVSFEGSPVWSECFHINEIGDWRNSDPCTRGITKVDFYCRCGPLECLYPNHYIHLWGSCSPTDCDWGAVVAVYRSDGWFTTVIDQGFAVRYVWAKAYTSNLLRLYIWTDFTNPSRNDYALDEWFIRN